MADFSPHQERIIKRYYNNQGAIKTQRLAELVSDLYLAEGKKRKQIWKWIAAALEQLKMPKQRIDHLIQQDNPALMADVVKEFSGK